MAKEAIVLKGKIELKNIEIREYCMLDSLTGEKIFYKEPKEKGFTGLYFNDKQNFFAIYPSKNGPIMYYMQKEYLLNKNLHISLKKMGDWREFHIEEYNINIKYRTSQYIGFDVWSEEEDVDLFYQIKQSYKHEEYYKKFTK